MNIKQQLRELVDQLHALARTVDTLVGQVEAQPERGGHSAARWDDDEARDARRRVFVATMKAVKRRIDTLMEEGSLAKSRRMEIGGEIDRLLQLFTSSAPFFMERFEENAEKVVATAKAWTDDPVLEARRVGISALQQGIEVPMLEAPKD